MDITFDDNELLCPQCGSPEKREEFIDNLPGPNGSGRRMYHYSCSECENTWTVTKRITEE